MKAFPFSSAREVGKPKFAYPLNRDVEGKLYAKEQFTCQKRIARIKKTKFFSTRR